MGCFRVSGSLIKNLVGEDARGVRHQTVYGKIRCGVKTHLARGLAIPLQPLRPRSQWISEALCPKRRAVAPDICSQSCFLSTEHDGKSQLKLLATGA
jgi:hypothetical protein